MNKLMLFMMIIIIWVFMISILILLVSKKSIIDLQKYTPFECGFNPMSYKRLPFSIHFFIAVIFLTFDIEIIIIVPINFYNKIININMLINYINYIYFNFNLSLFHEWFNGMLNWTN